MKITTSMKNVVMKAIEKKVENERKEKDKEVSDYAIKINSEIIDSEVYRNFIKSSNELKSLIESKVKDAKMPIIETYSSRQRFEGIISDTLCVVGNSRSKTNTRDLFDSIMVKLEYGKNFEEAKAILGEYGIDI